MTHAYAGWPAPLFDRLNDARGKPVDAGTAGDDTNRRLLQLGLARVFNLRNGLTVAQFLGDMPTSRDYGLPDILSLSPQSATGLRLLEQVLMRAIALYEPRLLQVRVDARPDPAGKASAQVAISGLAALGHRQLPVQFDLVLDAGRLEPQP
jgi:type VI secretion system protein ImpF